MTGQFFYYFTSRCLICWYISLLIVFRSILQLFLERMRHGGARIAMSDSLNSLFRFLIEEGVFFSSEVHLKFKCQGCFSLTLNRLGWALLKWKKANCDLFCTSGFVGLWISSGLNFICFNFLFSPGRYCFVLWSKCCFS